VLFCVTDVVVVYQVAEGLRGDGHHVGQDDSAVTAASEDQLVMRVIVADTPHPAKGQKAAETDG
jgi:thiamine monophosphate synthase